MAKDMGGTGSAVKRCHCSHKFQDKNFGKGRRLHTKTAKGWRCTVCANNKTV